MQLEEQSLTLQKKHVCFLFPHILCGFQAAAFVSILFLFSAAHSNATLTAAVGGDYTSPFIYSLEEQLVGKMALFSARCFFNDCAA